MQRKAVVLLSGGLDSTTVLAIARERGFENHALSFDYGQRHALELRAAAAVARSLGVTHRIVRPARLSAGARVRDRHVLAETERHDPTVEGAARDAEERGGTADVAAGRGERREYRGGVGRRGSPRPLRGEG
jgi:7-cyano-7-deazaguanine synthase in queuosine biosynthesis